MIYEIVYKFKQFDTAYGCDVVIVKDASNMNNDEIIFGGGNFMEFFSKHIGVLTYSRIRAGYTHCFCACSST